MRPTCIVFALPVLVLQVCSGFAPSSTFIQTRRNINNPSTASVVVVKASDLEVIGLVAGQENYGLAVVVLGEAIWSFSKAPSFDHAKVLVPGAVAAVVLAAVSGPMITSGDASSIGLGLNIATAVSVGLGASYVARLAAPFSPSPKEIAALGLVVAIAGFFSFAQNLVVDGFITLPSIELPPLPNVFTDLPLEQMRELSGLPPSE
jgi:hypothetical protein